MPQTNVLPIGRQATIVQNTVYALPARRCLLFCDTGAATFQQSTDLAFTANTALTLASGQAEVGGGFIRCTSGNVTAWLKPYI